MAIKKKIVKKKVVKRKVVKKAPKKIQNLDLVKYFKTGKQEHFDQSISIVGNVLQCVTDNPKVGDNSPVAVKIGDYIIINGDDVDNCVGEFDEIVSDLQNYGDNEVTTSFRCLKNAGIDLQKMKVLEITKDLDVICSLGEKRFNDFELTVPQGATYTEYDNCSSYNVDKASEEYDEVEANKIVEKRYHRAGCMLIREGKYSYICGMDEDSYFVTKLSKNTTTIDKAFQSLKSKAVQQWEKKNNIQAKRQGEWFFLPTTLTKVKGMRRKGLPLWKDGGNKHIADGYAVQDGKNYVKGNVIHHDHITTRLGDTIHEAHMNVALGSWSEQGVD